MKVGILTYHNAINFGANLQAVSTYNYFKSNGYEPIFINYCPSDFRNSYSQFPARQIEEHNKFMSSYCHTDLCSDAKSVGEMLLKLNIRNVVIGSDAVAQHHPFSSQIVFPSRKIISRSKPTSDRMFPNPFWGQLLDYAPNTNVCLMSVSSQQSMFNRFSKHLMDDMMNYISKFSYISVRDEWTKRMYSRISKGLIIPLITPDPVFGFNYNCEDIIASKEEILTKFNLNKKYILLGLRNGRFTSSDWSLKFEHECQKKGYECVGLPFPYGFNSLNQVGRKVNLPLSPVDWYALIKYSSGYVGHNMHTIVSALHNSIPCFSFDQYGNRFLMQWCDDSSSKIFDILNIAGFPTHRAVSATVISQIPSPEYVLEKILSFDVDHCKKFAADYYQRYLLMMKDIENTFVK